VDGPRCHHGGNLIREIRQGLNPPSNIAALKRPLGTLLKFTSDLTAEIGRRPRRDPRLGFKYLLCILEESADFPSFSDRRPVDIYTGPR
jgi:hypothetical protein